MTDMLWLPTDETPLLDAALAYASHDFRVVAVWNVRPEPDGRCYCGKADCRGLGTSAGKHPIGNAWQKRASSNVDAVRDARRGHPNANIGLAMGGAERLVAIDIDGQQGRDSLAEIESNVRPWPATLTSESGRPDGGEHRVMRVPVGLDIKRLGNRAKARWPGIDTRTDNGQIVVAPSLHVSGTRYRWKVRAPIAEMPEWLFECLAVPLEQSRPIPPRLSVMPPLSSQDGRRAYVAKVIENAAQELAAMKEGGRNSLLFAKACTVFEYHVGEGIDHLDAWKALAEGAAASGLRDTEISSVLSKAWRRAQGSVGRQVPDRSPSSSAMTKTSPTPAATTSSAPAATTIVSADSGEIDRSWYWRIEVDGKQVPKKTVGNAMTILSLDTRWKGVIAFDLFGDSVVTTRPPPVREQDRPAEHVAGEWSDEDTTRTAAWLSSEFGLDVGSRVVDDAVLAIARRNAVHPVRDYLLSLKWDGVARLDTWLVKYFGAADNEYTRGISARWMISAVARVFEPGCQADCTLVLESREQGLGKSTGLKLLCGAEWFASTGLNIGDKDSYQNLRRKWVYELGELTGIRGRELQRYKNFLSETVSNYRASYGKRNRDHARQCVFAGTTNESQYFDDRTGNRRFWPVKVSTVEREAIKRDRDQLWAEAYRRYADGAPWHVDTPAFRKLCEDEQAERLQDDPWEEIIARWLESPWVTDYDPIDGRVKAHQIDLSNGILTAEVLIGAIKKRPADIKREDEMRVAELLRGMGWERGPQQREGRRTVRRYRHHLSEVVTGGDAMVVTPQVGVIASRSLPVTTVTTSSDVSAVRKESTADRYESSAESGDGGDRGVDDRGYFTVDDL